MKSVLKTILILPMMVLFSGALSAQSVFVDDFSTLDGWTPGAVNYDFAAPAPVTGQP